MRILLFMFGGCEELKQNSLCLTNLVVDFLSELLQFFKTVAFQLIDFFLKPIVSQTDGFFVMFLVNSFLELLYGNNLVIFMKFLCSALPAKQNILIALRFNANINLLLEEFRMEMTDGRQDRLRLHFMILNQIIQITAQNYCTILFDIWLNRISRSLISTNNQFIFTRMDKLVEKRENHRIDIRKKDLKSHLFQRRLRIIQSIDSTPNTFQMFTQQCIVDFLKNPSLSTLTSLRKLTLQMASLQLVSSNNAAILKVCEYMAQMYDESEEQFEASWVLANVSMCHSSWELLAQLNIPALLMRRLKVVGGMNIKENCVWCFNNILTEECPLSTWLMNNKILYHLCEMLKESPNHSQLETTISCVIRLAKPPLSYVEFRCFLRPLLQMLNMGDSNVFGIACHCLSKFMLLDMHQILVADLSQSKALKRMILLIDKVNEPHIQHSFAHIVGCYSKNLQNVNESMRDDIYTCFNNILISTDLEPVIEEILWAIALMLSANQNANVEGCRKLLNHKIIKTILAIYRGTPRNVLRSWTMRIMAVCVAGGEWGEMAQVSPVELGIEIKGYYENETDLGDLEPTLEAALVALRRLTQY